ncbi:MAG: hypothetical protein KBC91_00525 [Candidatus Omnitrophica bacterium]|nr:hypothetical protein [Candidatus Omnitrophota bacterium]
MKDEYLKTLWLLRFEKMRKSEEAAAWKFQELLDQCLLQLDRDDPVIQLLSQLVREERMHERMAEEMINLCQITPAKS